MELGVKEFGISVAEHGKRGVHADGRNLENGERRGKRGGAGEKLHFGLRKTLGS